MYRLLMGSALAIALAAGSAATANAQFYPQYNYNLPPGSYQQSCTNISMNGPTLSATCSAMNGQRIYSSINVTRCGNSGIINSNGRLTCNGYGYNNGYGYGDGYGYGNNNGRGHAYGHRHHRDRDNDNDDNDDNDNGRYNNGYGYGNGGYNNGGYGYGYGSLPPGSYQASCTNESMRGPVLSATCTASNGQQIYSSINASSCLSQGLTIRNENGRLRCF